MIVTAPLSIAGRGPDERGEMEVQPTVESYDQLVDEVTQDEPRASAIEWLITAGMWVAAVLAIWLAVEESEPVFFVLGAGFAALGGFGSFALTPSSRKRAQIAMARRRAAFMILACSGADLGSRKQRRNTATFNAAIDQWREYQANSNPRDVPVEVIQSNAAPTPVLGLTIDTSGGIQVISGTPVPNPLTGRVRPE